MAGNRWFRLYAEFASDPKVQILPEAMQRRLVMLFCLRCSNDLVTLQDEEIAFQLRISIDDLAATKAVFLAKGFIDEGWNIANWKKRQFVSDSSAERVARHREKKRKQKQQPGNVTATPPDTETDTDKPTSLRSVGDTARTNNRDGIPVPDDFTPNRTMRLKAGELGIDPDAEKERFILHHQAATTLRADETAWQKQFGKWLLDQHQINADRERITQSRMQASQSNTGNRQAAMSSMYNPPRRDMPAEREIQGETIHEQ
ncbi:hypothetical protein [Chromobacterium subtsugae]|uniref:hypothetical protein n=1 Tax=Chromobacterium subtsugae TaxID=251747 RepID=UPI0007F8C2A5|nr:hypothetical protein [Chromobacterium subtsugae]